MGYVAEAGLVLVAAPTTLVEELDRQNDGYVAPSRRWQLLSKLASEMRDVHLVIIANVAGFALDAEPDSAEHRAQCTRLGRETMSSEDRVDNFRCEFLSWLNESRHLHFQAAGCLLVCR
jgi:hypothetical protein